jgi:YhcH/YjgK/YiaL family protein
MAILGYLADLFPLYNKSDKNIYKGLVYLKKLSTKTFDGVKPGQPVKDEFGGKNIFALHQVYLPKDPSQGKLEGHKAYIDIQFIFSGTEMIYLAQRKDCRKETPYNKKKDIQFFKAKAWSVLELKPGMVAIFYPQDIHAPSLSAGAKGIIRKSVVKVALRR